MATYYAQTIIGEALSELNVLQPGASVPTAMAVLCLSKLNQIFDNWNADRQTIWSEIFTPFTLTANLSPHTIGPSGATWTMTVRPVTLDGCYLNLNTQTPNVYVPIDIIDWQTYQDYISVPGIASSIPTAVYYEPDWPKGKLYFYPVPSTAYAVRLATRTLLADVALTDAVSMPPGYRNAVTLTLAEDIATPLGAEVPAVTSVKARQARARIFANNVQSPSLNLQDGQQRTGTTNFNYLSRSFRG